MSDSLDIEAGQSATLTISVATETLTVSTGGTDTLDITSDGITTTLSAASSSVLIVDTSEPTQLVIEPNNTQLVVEPGRGPRGPQGPAGEGGTATVVAGATLSGHRVVRPQGDGTVIYATNADLADSGRALWLTLGAALAGADVAVQMVGKVDEPSWSWTDAPVYLGVDGALTQTTPVSPALFLVQVGSPDGPTSLFYDPRMPIAL